jgi:hypothetical protein
MEVISDIQIGWRTFHGSKDGTSIIQEGEFAFTGGFGISWNAGEGYEECFDVLKRYEGGYHVSLSSLHVSLRARK